LKRRVIDPQGRLVLCDDGEVEFFVALHGETEKAWSVSTTGDARDAVYLPKSLCELLEQVGQLDQPPAVTLRRERAPVWWCSLPHFKAVEKGLWPPPRFHRRAA